MTRINVIPVKTLCDQHLLAEHRELTRIPNCLVSGKYRVRESAPTEYTLGAGHVRFFFTRLAWLKRRHRQLHRECLARGFNVVDRWPTEPLPEELWGDYRPTARAKRVNLARIAVRWPAKARFWGEATPLSVCLAVR